MLEVVIKSGAPKNLPRPKNLIKILNNNKITKIFHYARFDVAVLKHSYNINLKNIDKGIEIFNKSIEIFNRSYNLSLLQHNFRNPDTIG